MTATSVRLRESVLLVGSGEAGITHYLDCHVYLLESDGEYALVDAGAGVNSSGLVANIREVIGSRGELRYLFLTHCHGDHAGGVTAVQDEFAGVTVVASPFEANMLERGSEHEIGLTQAKYSGVYPPDFAFHHAAGACGVEHNAELTLGALRVRVLHTPGHTKGSTCFAVEGSGSTALFSGDTVFWGGLIQLLNTPGSELADYRRSALMLEAIERDALFPGHGLWVLRHASAHLRQMGDYFRRSGPPPMPAKIEKVVHG